MSSIMAKVGRGAAKKLIKKIGDEKAEQSGKWVP